MNDKFFNTLNEWGIPISWTFIKIGMTFNEYDFKIKSQDVFDYASYLLENNPEKEDSLTKILANYGDDNEIYNDVINLSEKENADMDIENRKWIIYTLHLALSSISKPPTHDDLFMLGNLWYCLGMPAHYPWDVKQNEYIKCEDIQQMLSVHYDWINSEIEFFKSRYTKQYNH